MIRQDDRSFQLCHRLCPAAFGYATVTGRAQKLPSARLLSWYDRAKLRLSWHIVVAVYRD